LKEKGITFGELDYLDYSDRSPDAFAFQGVKNNSRWALISTLGLALLFLKENSVGSSEHLLFFGTLMQSMTQFLSRIQKDWKLFLPKFLKWYKDHSIYPFDISLFGAGAGLFSLGTMMVLGGLFNIQSSVIQLLIFMPLLYGTGSLFVGKLYGALSRQLGRRYPLVLQPVQENARTVVAFFALIAAGAATVWYPNATSALTHNIVIFVLGLIYAASLGVFQNYWLEKAEGELVNRFKMHKSSSWKAYEDALRMNQYLQLGKGYLSIVVREVQKKSGNAYFWKIDIFGYPALMIRSGRGGSEVRKGVSRLLFEFAQRILDYENVTALVESIRHSLANSKGLGIEEAVKIAERVRFSKDEIKIIERLILDIRNLVQDRTVSTDKNLYKRLEIRLDTLNPELKMRILRLPDFHHIYLSNEERPPSADGWSMKSKEQMESENLVIARKRLELLAKQLEDLTISPDSNPGIIGGILVALFILGSGTAYAAVPGMPLPVGLEGALYGVVVAILAWTTEFFIQRTFSIEAIAQDTVVYLVALMTIGSITAYFYSKISVRLKRSYTLVPKTAHWESMKTVLAIAVFYSIFREVVAPVRGIHFWDIIHMYYFALSSAIYSLSFSLIQHVKSANFLSRASLVFDRNQERTAEKNRERLILELEERLEKNKKIQLGKREHIIKVKETRSKNGDVTWKIEIFGIKSLKIRWNSLTTEFRQNPRREVAELTHEILQRIIEKENFMVLVDSIDKILKKYRGGGVDEAIAAAKRVQFYKSEIDVVKNLTSEIKKLGVDPTIHSTENLHQRFNSLLEDLNSSSFGVDGLDLKTRILRLKSYKTGPWVDLEEARKNLKSLSIELEDLATRPVWLTVESRIKSIEQELEQSKKGLGGEILDGLSPMGMMALKEVRRRVVALTKDFGSSSDELSRHSRQIHLEEVWNLDGISLPARKLWFYLNSLSWKSQDRNLTPPEFLFRLSGLKKTLDELLLKNSPKNVNDIISKATVLEQEKMQVRGLKRMARLLAFEGKKLDETELTRGIEASLGRLPYAGSHEEKISEVKEILRTLALLKGLNETGVGVKNPKDEYMGEILSELFKKVDILPIEHDFLTLRFEATANELQTNWHSQELKRLEDLFADWVALGIWAKDMANRDEIEIADLPKKTWVYDISSLFKSDEKSDKEAANIIAVLSRDIKAGENKIVLVADGNYPTRRILEEKLGENLFGKLTQGSLTQGPARILSGVVGEQNKIRLDEVYRQLENSGWVGEGIQILTGSVERWEESHSKSVKAEIYELISTTRVKLHIDLKLLSEEMRRIKVLKIQA